MNLYLLRHAIAVEPGTPGYTDDASRPLTQKGSAKMHSIARGMKKIDLEFDLVISSPYLRARQTAEIVMDVFGIKGKPHISETLVPDTNGAPIVTEIRENHAGKQNILLVSHEPLLSTLISVLISGDSSLDITMKKGGLCCLNTDDLRYTRCATLEFLLYPYQLAELGS